MAEIKIKKKAPIWPWIVGALVVALLVYLLVFNDKDDDFDDMVVVDETEQVVVPDTVDNTSADTRTSEIDEYNMYISDQSNMDMSHEYSSNALTKLIAATKATANNLGVDINADLSEADKKATEITNNPESLKHANMIKDAAQKITNALKTIQTEKFPDLESQYKEVESAVSNIDAKKATLDQKDAIKGFFDKASNLLTSIQNNHGQAQ